MLDEARPHPTARRRPHPAGQGRSVRTSFVVAGRRRRGGCSTSVYDKRCAPLGARGAGPLDARADVVVRRAATRQRLTQALVQLAGNAVRHTSARRRVAPRLLGRQGRDGAPRGPVVGARHRSRRSRGSAAHAACSSASPRGPARAGDREHGARAPRHRCEPSRRPTAAPPGSTTRRALVTLDLPGGRGRAPLDPPVPSGPSQGERVP